MFKNILTSAITGAIVAGIAFVVLVGGHPQTKTLGGTTNFDTLAAGVQVTVATNTPATTAELIAFGTGTTTLVLDTSGANKPSCIQGKNTVGAPFTAWVGSTNTWVISTSTTASCK